MYDELDSLREVAGLVDLLRHYADLAAPDRLLWQKRVSAHPTHDRRTLTRLHGELIAGGWVEQNTGHSVASYRVTPAGLRALRDLTEG